MENPVLVHSLRGDIVENRHRGAVAVIDPAGRSILTLGDVDAPVYPRSAIKALQALPLIESGAADHFSLSQAEIALACSSHGAEPVHVNAVLGWLSHLGLKQDTLECGAHLPLHERSAHAMIRSGDQPARVHNNCSGKHTGMLATACFLGEETGGYIEREHPAQQRWFDALGEMADVDMRRLPWSRDGCGIPVVAMPLRSIATAFARFAAPDDQPQARAGAIERIAGAIAAQPYMVAGEGRLCTEIMELTGKRVIVKTGADGVYSAALPDSGLGIAIKIDDGAGAAAEVAVLAILQKVGALREDELAALADRRRAPITNTRGVTTGYREPAETWFVETGK